MLWQSEGFVEQAPLSRRRARPPPGAYSLVATAYAPSTCRATASPSSPSSRSPPCPKTSTQSAASALSGAASVSNGVGDASPASPAPSALSGSDDHDAFGTTYAVEAILKVRARDGAKEYLVSWEGYSADHDSWEPPENLGRCTVFQDWIAAAKAARALRNAGTVVSDANAGTTATPTPPTSSSASTSHTTTTATATAATTPRRKSKGQFKTFTTPRHAAKHHEASMRSTLHLTAAPGVHAGKIKRSSSSKKDAGGSGAGGPMLTYHSPSKRLPHIWGQLVSGHFGGSGGGARQQQQQQGGAAAAAHAVVLKPKVPVALRKKEPGSASAAAFALASSFSSASSAKARPSPSTPRAGKKAPQSPASARSAHHRKLQREIFARRHATTTAAGAAKGMRAGGAAKKRPSLNARIAAVRAPAAALSVSAAAAAAAAATAAAAAPTVIVAPTITSSTASRAGLRPLWCAGKCHWTNCLCTPPAKV